MCRLTAAYDAGAYNARKSPAFTRHEHGIISAWTKTIEPTGLCTKIHSDHEFLTEALHVTNRDTGDILWLVHKTNDGAVAVRLWPGLADIVPSLTDALALITEAAELRHQAARA